MDKNEALLALLIGVEKSFWHTSNPPMTNNALMLCFRICSAILSTCFAGSVLKTEKKKKNNERYFWQQIKSPKDINSLITEQATCFRRSRLHKKYLTLHKFCSIWDDTPRLYRLVPKRDPPWPVHPPTSAHLTSLIWGGINNITWLN